MKVIVACLLLIVSTTCCIASEPSDSLLKQLNAAIKETALYDAVHLRSIAETQQLLNNSIAAIPDIKYDICLKLYEGYKYYNFDSALYYAKQLQHFAAFKNDASLVVDARIKEVFIMLSGGMFKETLDSLTVISIKGASNVVKAEYYSLLARAYYNFADFDSDNYYTPRYNKKANYYLDSALQLYPQQSFEYGYYMALQQLKKGNPDVALLSLNKVMARQNLQLHQIAVATSTIGGILMSMQQDANAKPYLMQAAIADVKSSTKETLALLSLANIIFKEGDVQNAAVYIEKANADATFYKARLRKVQIGAILPLIEGQMIKTIQSQKEKLITSLIVFAFLILLLAGFAIIVRNQVRKLKIARLSLLHINQQLIEANDLKEKYNSQLKETNRQLVEANAIKEKYNEQLKAINHQLLEANKIKEEYIGYYFRIDTEFMLRIEKLMANIDKKLIDRKWDEIKLLLKTLDLKKEKEDLLKNFDKVFIKLFPNFVSQFNTLFLEDDKIIIKDDQLLNTELRIFALMRLGITENEKIAEILNYSINTIYSYKTKIRNKANIAKDDFDNKVMEITTLSF